MLATLVVLFLVVAVFGMASAALPSAGDRSCNQYASVPTTGREFTTSIDSEIVEVHFRTTAGAAFTTETVTLEAEGQSWFQGQAVPITLLQTAAAHVVPGAQSIIIWRPPIPIRFNFMFPFKVTPSAVLGVVLVANAKKDTA